MTDQSGEKGRADGVVMTANRGRPQEPPEKDAERLRVHATYSRRIGRQSLARALDRGADAIDGSDRWWICTDQLARGGKKVMGPFATDDLALRVRDYVEAERDNKRVGRTFWVDKEGGPRA